MDADSKDNADLQAVPTPRSSADQTSKHGNSGHSTLESSSQSNDSSVDLVKHNETVDSGQSVIDTKQNSFKNAPDLLVDIPTATGTATKILNNEECNNTNNTQTVKKTLQNQDSSSVESLTEKVQPKGRVENYESSPYDDSSDSPYVMSSSEEFEQPVLSPGVKDDLDLLDSPQAFTNSRPDSLSLPRPLQFHERDKGKDSDQPVFQRVKEDPLKAVTTESLPQGTITREGNMVEFVATDLLQKIKMSSPSSSLDGSRRTSRTSSMRASSSLNSISSMCTSWSSSATGMSRSPSHLQQSPDEVPPIDPRAVLDLEIQARKVADSLDLLMGNLKTSLQKMSSLTVSCVDAYKDGVDKTCDSVDSSIKAMYALMAKCEELNHSMQPVHNIAEQIREIKRLLDLFESQLVQS